MLLVLILRLEDVARPAKLFAGDTEAETALALGLLGCCVALGNGNVNLLCTYDSGRLIYFLFLSATGFAGPTRGHTWHFYHLGWVVLCCVVSSAFIASPFARIICRCVRPIPHHIMKMNHDVHLPSPSNHHIPTSLTPSSLVKSLISQLKCAANLSPPFFPNLSNPIRYSFLRFTSKCPLTTST